MMRETLILIVFILHLLFQTPFFPIGCNLPVHRMFLKANDNVISIRHKKWERGELLRKWGRKKNPEKPDVNLRKEIKENRPKLQYK